MSKGRSCGNLFIDPAYLRMNRLSVKDMARNNVMDNIVDSSLIDFPKVDYTPEAKYIFRDLTRFFWLRKK